MTMYQQKKCKNSLLSSPQFLNLIIDNGNVLDTDRETLFPDDEVVHIIRPGNPILKNMYDILVILGVYKSKSEARKNWKKTGTEIPEGWSHFPGLGKFRKELCIWNPAASTVERS